MHAMHLRKSEIKRAKKSKVLQHQKVPPTNPCPQEFDDPTFSNRLFTDFYRFNHKRSILITLLTNTNAAARLYAASINSPVQNAAKAYSSTSHNVPHKR